MDRIAVISDIHGNIPALDAVVKDIRARGIDRIFCLGDMVGKGPHSEIAVDRVKELCEVVIRGNWDDAITRPQKNEVIAWHQERLGEERLAYLRALPFSIDFYMSGKKVRLVHASPQSVYHRIQPWDPPEQRLAMFENTELIEQREDDLQPDTVGYGDVHNAYVQNFFGKTLFNVGSVGNPLEITQASYVILEGQYESRQPSVFSLQLVRVPYDIEYAIQLAEEENMPQLEAYIKELRTARYRGLQH